MFKYVQSSMEHDVMSLIYCAYLRQQFIKKKDDQTSNEQLNNNQAADTGSHLRRITVHTSQYIDDSLAKCHNHTKEFLGSRKQSSEWINSTDFQGMKENNFRVSIKIKYLCIRFKYIFNRLANVLIEE